MTSNGDEICMARPRRAEWVQAAFVYPLAAVVVTAMGSMGIDAIFPSFLTEDHAVNRWRMAAIFVPMVVLLVVATYRANRLRYYRLFDDRLEIGRSGEECVRLADVQRMRVGAPSPGWVRTVARANAAIGKVKRANANAAQALARQFARTVVLDLGPRQRRVINLATVDRGEELLAALTHRLGDRVEVPPTYSEEELAVFGRFVPRLYEV